jgi:hypothetical protein
VLLLEVQQHLGYDCLLVFSARDFVFALRLVTCGTANQTVFATTSVIYAVEVPVGVEFGRIDFGHVDTCFPAAS